MKRRILARKRVVTAGFSSTILLAPLDVSLWRTLCWRAEAIGPAGLTLVIVRDLLGKAHESCPSILDYTVLNDNDSMFNTPPTFARIFRSGVQMVESAGRRGGDAQKINQQKAELLYGAIDNSDFTATMSHANRSRMNVPFQLADTRWTRSFRPPPVCTPVRAPCCWRDARLYL